MKDFKDRVAVVTGAASGIGRALAHGFVEAGMKVVLADIEAESLLKTTRVLKDSGADVIGVVMDVSIPGDIETLAQKTLEAYGSVHVLCNNAGLGYSMPNCWETSIEGWQWVLGVNLMGVINGVQTFMPVFLEQDTEAHIVNTASIAGLLTNQLSVPYGVAKHGVVVFSESLHLNLQQIQSKVKVSVLCPGPVNTDILNSSERLRPASVPAPPEPDDLTKMLIQAYHLWLERGMSPQEVASRVIEAIRAEQFFIITHDFNTQIEARFNNILDSNNPEQLQPPQDFMEILNELMSKA